LILPPGDKKNRKEEKVVNQSEVVRPHKREQSLRQRKRI